MRATPELGPDLLVACARDYTGTPWVHQGRLRGVGVDCIGLLVCAARDAGLEVADIANYPTVPAGTWLLGELEQRLCRSDADDLRAGDVLAFAWGLHPWHVALYTAQGSIIHAYRRAERCLEQPLDAHWRAALHSAWRWPEWMATARVVRDAVKS